MLIKNRKGCVLDKDGYNKHLLKKKTSEQMVSKAKSELGYK